MQKIKILKFGTKKARFPCFRAGDWNIIVIFEISVLEFVLLQSLVQMKIFKFGTKNALFGYFWAEIWKWYCHIWNQHPRICLTAKPRKKKKKKKNKAQIWAQKWQFRYFWPKIPYLGFFGGKNFKKTIAIFEIRVLKFVY